MGYEISRRSALMLGAALAAIGAPRAVLAASRFWLVPPDQQLDVDTGSALPPTPQAEPDAPQILVESPKTGGDPIHAPVSIALKFVPAAGAAIDPAAFKVAARILGGWMDVTPEILKHAQVKASGVQVTGAMLPKGKHRIRLQIKDDKGRLGENVIGFEIA
jgi:hypothetical protein